MLIKTLKNIKEEDLIKMEFIHYEPNGQYLKNNQISKINGQEYLIDYDELYYTDKKNLINDIDKGINITIYDFVNDDAAALEKDITQTHKIIRYMIKKIQITKITKIIEKENMPLFLEQKITGENK